MSTSAMRRAFNDGAGHPECASVRMRGNSSGHGHDVSFICGGRTVEAYVGPSEDVIQASKQAGATYAQREK